MEDDGLPPKLELDGAYDRLIRRLYAVFRKDFIESRPVFRGLPVVFDDRRIDSDYAEGFWHLITRKDGGDRLLDYKRAKRLPWLRPLIELGPDPDILLWEEDELDRRRGQMRRKHFIWYENGSYLIILKEIPGRYFLATDFHITGQREHDRYMKQYLGQKKGTGC